MIKINSRYLDLQGSYLFADISKKVKEYAEKHPDKKIIRLGIGDVTEALAPSVIKGLKLAVHDMSKKETFKGYSPDYGYEFLIEIINKNDFASRSVKLDSSEIFITSGAKEDTSNFQELFSADIKVAITDPVYPVYIDSNIMAGRAGKLKNSRYENIVYLECSKANNFIPSLPEEKVDLIYLCFPNNPTGQTATKNELKKWVNYARENRALILFDAAYEAFITEKEIPHSIFEIEGAKEVAVEFQKPVKNRRFYRNKIGLYNSS